MNIEDLLKLMVEKGASDIYITAGIAPAFRVEGQTESDLGEPLTPEDTERIAFSIMSEKQKATFLENKEMNLALAPSSEGRFRVNIFYQMNNIGLVVRQIKTPIQSFSDLGLPSVLEDISMTKRGLVIVVGATGSGKSTTLSAMIDHRNSSSSGHIITVEDPIEFVHQHKQSIVTHREVGIDTNSFSEALKNTLRQAPDVILIGEIRDTETMEAAITFAETGHLCLATLHANNANQSIERIINFFPAERHEQIYLLLSLNLRSIISQRLIPAVEEKRVAALEVLMDTPRIKDLILKKEIGLLKEAMKQGEQEGMQTFDQAIYNFYVQGKIDYKTAIAYADSANDLRLRIKFDTPGHEEEGKNKPIFKIREQ
ncbi:twitching mobility protein Pilt [Candidatus Scalindua japonica]|uniref:Twitching mobility protein Pilt n=1 Tax=Candidatus Scalindua japonica TaxID=1284222 RepID=A0A286TYU2_9BACT|nr:PilT/PilU family type 4a pilus ATPase [Candidatus Scalindua japonica]GAX61073.1 twitching mobility protein Pilt [Candidatus Scalindua japonica]